MEYIVLCRGVRNRVQPCDGPGHIEALCYLCLQYLFYLQNQSLWTTYEVATRSSMPVFSIWACALACRIFFFFFLPYERLNTSSDLASNRYLNRVYTLETPLRVQLRPDPYNLSKAYEQDTKLLAVRQT